MMNKNIWRVAGVAMLCVVASAFAAAPKSVEKAAADDDAVLSQRLAPMDGAHLTVKLYEVTYPVGAGSKPHSHPCVVVGYVVDGVIRSQVKGEAEQSYAAGKAFYEPANGVHLVSGNGSTKQASKLLAIFICDKDAPLTTPPVDAARAH
jgi:quercetin dioxygenase-like cupin family protein